MIFSGTTKDFHKDFSKLPELVRKRAQENWDQWRHLTKEASRHHQKPTDLESRFDDLAKRMCLRETSIGDGIYRCDLGLGYRALGQRFEDESGKPRIVWFWTGSHADYDKLIKNGNDRKLIKSAEKAHLDHSFGHIAWKQNRRIRVDLSLLKNLRQHQHDAPYRPRVRKPSSAQRRQLALA